MLSKSQILGRPQKSPQEALFMNLMRPKSMCILSHTQLKLTMYQYSKRHSNQDQLPKGRKHKKLKNEIGYQQVVQVKIKQLKDPIKNNILNQFKSIIKNQKFKDFNIIEGQEKIYIGPQQLCWIYSKFWPEQRQDYQYQFSCQIALFICLIHLVYTKEMSLNILPYFQQNVQYILEELNKNIPHILPMLRLKSQTEKFKKSSNKQNRQQNENSLNENDSCDISQYLSNQNFHEKLKKQSPIKKNKGIKKNSGKDKKSEEKPSQQIQVEPNQQQVVQLYEYQLADDLCNYICHSLNYSLKTLSTQKISQR